MSELIMSRALRAYELGRLRLAMKRAALASVVAALIGAVYIAPSAAVMAAPLFVAVVFAEWRGGSLARGARRGVAAGMVTLLLPMTLLRPCCDAAMRANGACCTMPSMCGLAGVVVGLGVAAVWPRESGLRSHALAGLGVLMGAAAVVAVRCVGLFAGEAMGLGLGLGAGIAASAVARTWLSVRHHTRA
jgi:hypothetical protein